MANELITLDVFKRKLDGYKEQIAHALPRHITPDRMIRLALTTFSRNPDLAKCDLRSIMGCIIQASQLGLEFDGVLGQAYMVPFYNNRKKQREAQLIVGYKGFLSLARRSGEVSAFFAHVVHQNDVFKFAYGTRSNLEHVPLLANRGDPIAVYAVVALKDPIGASDFEVIGWEEILKWQGKYASKSQNGEMYGPWVDHLEEMAKKTAIRRLAKRVPVSVEIQRAASLDEYGETGQEQRLSALVDASRTADLEAKLASRANGSHTPATPAQLDNIRMQLAALEVSEEVYNEHVLEMPANPAALSSQQAAEVLAWLDDVAERAAVAQQP